MRNFRPIRVFDPWVELFYKRGKGDHILSGGNAGTETQAKVSPFLLPKIDTDYNR